MVLTLDTLGEKKKKKGAERNTIYFYMCWVHPVRRDSGVTFSYTHSHSWHCACVALCSCGAGVDCETSFFDAGLYGLCPSF